MKNRENLAFALETKNEFDFLISKYGFRITSSSDTKILYESKKVYIEIFHGEYDYEVGIYFGRVGKTEKFSFLLFCGLMKLESVTSVEMISDDKLQVKKLLAIQAEALAKSGINIIEGDDAIFERMKTVRWWDFCPEALEK